ncbi:imidazolonepropionase [Ekhidna lutea]|uniref:Imidazolonepropionase n=1 Tax=Ekhidna lutea TaxID=447679 RepID=A0A239KSI6_EKHLU|nr:imidazolonepropionase [Ekhidna lutea]SNT20583.1 imidazolonepropionase [Ekhidna lutea]
MSKLIGPFKEVITLAKTPEKGVLADSSLLIIENGGVLVEDEKILKTGSFESLSKEADQIEEVESAHVLMPGLVDCHTHLVWGGTRARDYTLRMSGESYEKILEQGGGIFDSVEKTRGASSEVLKEGLVKRANRHLNDGVTTIEVKSGYGLDVGNELKVLEVVKNAKADIKADLIPTCLAAHVCPKEFSDKKEFLTYLENELLPQLLVKGLTNRIDIFVEPSAFPVEIAKDYMAAARKLGFDLTIHADQFHTGGSQIAVELGARSADHLEASTDKEVELLAKSDTVAVALPGASIGLGMQFTPARKLLDAGASLAISTDWNPGSGPMGDLLVQAAILGIYEKLSSAEIFSGITFRAAKALGLDDRGRIAVGKKADMIAFPVDDYREILYNQGKIKPDMIWKNGKQI